jgi:molybdopterin molybdotransferase
MVSVKEVDQIIHASLIDFGTERIPLAQAIGRVLKEEIKADRDFPPFDRVMMDGIGIRYEDWQRGTKDFHVEGLVAAGSERQTLSAADHCLEVMTGAVMPDGADTVVKYEEVTITDGLASINIAHQIKPGQHIHKQGTDRLQDDVLIPSNRQLTSADVAILATVGKTEVVVSRAPKVAVIATGDELVDIDQEPLPHQIRKSNVYAILTDLQAKGFVAEAFHFVDDKDELRRGLKGIIEAFDVIVMSGGVSKGKFDYIPNILEELGVEKKFHFVRQRPGKPFWFGRYKNGNGVVFALPGNPVSTFVGLYRYVIPFLYRSAGLEPVVVQAQLEEDFRFEPDLTYFLQVKLRFNEQGVLLARPVPGLGSGDLANLLEADGLLELPTGQTEYKFGEVFRCYRYR